MSTLGRKKRKALRRYKTCETWCSVYFRRRNFGLEWWDIYSTQGKVIARIATGKRYKYIVIGKV